MTEVEHQPRVSRSRLAALRVDELRALATTLGVGRASTMRKGTLVDAINDRYDDIAGTGADVTDEQQAPEVPQEEQQAAPDEPRQQEEVATEPIVEASADDEQPAASTATEPAPEQSTESGADAAPEQEQRAPDAAAETEQPVAEPVESDQATESSVPSPDEQEGGADTPDAAAESQGSGDPKPAAEHVNAGITGIAEDLQELQREQGSEQADGEQTEGERPSGRRGRGRGRGRGNQQNQNAQQTEPAADEQAEPQQQNGRQGNQNQGGQNQGGQQNQNGQQQPADGEGRRGRYRDRKRRGAGNEWDEPEIRDDDVLIPIAGILDVLENYAFVRTSGYLSGANDVYVSLGQVKKYALRKGDAVVGAIRQVPDSEQQQRQKYNALVKVDSINGLPVAESEGRVEFEQLTPLYPQERLRLETEAQKLSTRVVDLVAPIGKGQRGLIVSPPKSGKTLMLQSIANAITKNNPEVHLMVVLVDERPEEVTDMQRTVKGEVIASTFDRPAEDHTTVAELAIERAKRLVELGYDVVVLLDSITRLSRAYNLTVPASGRTLAGGIDPAALAPAKRFFGAARNIENGGSLTIIATALVETGAKADEAVFEEFAGTENMELRLDSRLAERRIYPAIDVAASGTRREELLMGPDEVKVTWQLRRALAGLDTAAALDVVTGKMRETTSNVEFLVQMQKSLPSAK